MLFAASIKVSYRKAQRRIDVVVEADELETAKEKAIKQARKIYLPSKKAVYTVTEIINENDAYQTLANPKSTETPEINNHDEETTDAGSTTDTGISQQED